MNSIYIFLLSSSSLAFLSVMHPLHWISYLSTYSHPDNKHTLAQGSRFVQSSLEKNNNNNAANNNNNAANILHWIRINGWNQVGARFGPKLPCRMWQLHYIKKQKVGDPCSMMQIIALFKEDFGVINYDLV